MLILRDDPVLELFESPATPPNWIEAIDIVNGEYSLCDEHGQRYVGVLSKPVGGLSPEKFELRPEGAPDILNALSLVDRAVALEPNKYFADLSSLRRHLTLHSSGTGYASPSIQRYAP